MEPGDGGPIYEGQYYQQKDSVHAPSCQRCLKIIDRTLLEVEPDDRFNWTLIRALEEMRLWGCVAIADTPGDQEELMRKRLRAEARQNGWKIFTRYAHGTLHMSCLDALTPDRKHAVEADRNMRLEYLWNRLDDPEPLKPPRPSWQLVWGC